MIFIKSVSLLIIFSETTILKNEHSTYVALSKVPATGLFGKT